MFIPSIDHLEIDITYACGLHCHNCNRLTHLLPALGRENVSLAQVRRLIDESVRLRYPWKRLSVLGGEPTQHPRFIDIVECLADYKRVANPDVLIQVSTNGVSDATKAQLSAVRRRWPNVKIFDTHKTTRYQLFDPITMAPQDRQECPAGYQYEGCGICASSGIGFNHNGFYCCAIAGAIDRVFKIGTRVKHVADITHETLVAMYNEFCSKCGHYGNPDKLTTTALSMTWVKALRGVYVHYEANQRKGNY